MCWRTILAIRWLCLVSDDDVTGWPRFSSAGMYVARG